MAIINCPECNNEISDKAAACPKCGYPINGMQTPQAVSAPPVQQQASNSQQYSDLYPKIKEYKDRVNTIFVLSIIGVVLCFGIGVIFAIISTVLMSRLSAVNEEITSPFELAEYQTAEKRLKTAWIMSGITIIIGCVGLASGIIYGIMMI